MIKQALLDELSEICMCCICMDGIELPISCVDCSNNFCKNCIETYLVTKRSCPFCRAKFRGIKNNALSD